MEPSQIGEDPGGDPDAGCGHRGTHENCELSRSTADRKPLDRKESQRKRSNNTHQSDEQSRGPQPGERAKIGLETDLEEKQDHADLSQGGEQTPIIATHPPEHARPDDGSDQQFPNYCGLTKPGHDLGTDLGRDQDHQQLDKTLEDFHRNSHPGAPAQMLGDSAARSTMEYR